MFRKCVLCFKLWWTKFCVTFFDGSNFFCIKYFKFSKIFKLTANYLTRKTLFCYDFRVILMKIFTPVSLVWEILKKQPK